MKKLRIIFGISGLLVIAGLVLIGLSSAYSPYKNEAAYDKARSAIEDRRLTIGDADRVGYATREQDEVYSRLSREWSDLRDRSLSPKYPLFDHGLALSLLGASLALASGLFLVFSPRPRRRILSPSKAYFYVSANLGVVALCIGGVASILIDYGRGAYPYWSDSLAIPIFGAAFLFIFLLPIFNVTALLLSLGYEKGRRMNRGSSRRITRILRFVPLALTLALLVMAIVPGDYSSVTALVVWAFMFAARAFYPKTV